MMYTRRRFLTTVSLAGAAGLLRPPSALAAEETLETTTIRMAKGTRLLSGGSACRRGAATR